MVVDALTEAELRELKATLEADRATIEEQLEHLAGAARPVALDQQVQGRLSRMDALQQQAMSQAEQRQAKLHLNRINLALKAMDSGDYGYCRQCDNFIGFPRLKARPDSPICVKCAEAAERA